MTLRTLFTGISIATLLGVTMPLVTSAEPQASYGLDDHDKVVRKMTSPKALYMLKCAGLHVNKFADARTRARNTWIRRPMRERERETQ